jgi:hypothetical protein
VEDPDDIAAKQALLNRLNEMKEQSQNIAQKIAGREPPGISPPPSSPGKNHLALTAHTIVSVLIYLVPPGIPSTGRARTHIPLLSLAGPALRTCIPLPFIPFSAPALLAAHFSQRTTAASTGKAQTKRKELSLTPILDFRPLQSWIRSATSTHWSSTRWGVSRATANASGKPPPPSSLSLPPCTPETFGRTLLPDTALLADRA